MAFVGKREKRAKQVNVRLNESDAVRFQEVMDFNYHQTVSDSVRDMIRSGWRDFQNRSQRDIDKIMETVPKESDSDTKTYQLNVRLTAAELGMTDFLMLKMHCKSISESIRNLINIFHVTAVEGRKGPKARTAK